MIALSGSFLEVSLQCLGFSDAWIRGVTAFYKYATSAITSGGFVCSSFTLTRSIKQGCPLVAYLYLMIGEVMLDFLCG